MNYSFSKQQTTTFQCSPSPVATRYAVQVSATHLTADLLLFATPSRRRMPKAPCSSSGSKKEQHDNVCSREQALAKPHPTPTTCRHTHELYPRPLTRKSFPPPQRARGTRIPRHTPPHDPTRKPALAAPPTTPLPRPHPSHPSPSPRSP